jgi:hypothetical protein
MAGWRGMVTMRLLVAIGAVVVVIAVGVVLAVTRNAVSQPIEFNHRLHIEDVGSECVDCHIYAVDGVRATIPNVDICAECHEEALGESAEEAKVVDHIAQGVPIPWRKIYRVPDHVYFSHRRHSGIAGIECKTCHGDVEQRVRPFTRAAVRTSMGRCMGCHDKEGVSNDCVACHR